jgi:hypothetical protein
VSTWTGRRGDCDNAPPAALVVGLSIAVAAGREAVGVTTSISILGGDVIGVTRGQVLL